MGGALRKGSFNQKLARVASEYYQKAGHTVELVTLAQFQIPLYDGDFEEASDAAPAGVQLLGQKIAAANAVVFSAPEYNGGISGVFKNAIDWISRLDPMPLRDKPILLLGASPGGLGAVRGLWHTRVPLEAMGAWVFPGMHGLSQAHAAFNEQGAFLDAKNQSRLEDSLKAFTKFAAAAIQTSN